MMDEGTDRFALNVADGAWAGSLVRMDGRRGCTVLPVLAGDIDDLADSLPILVGV